jgi:hypothetical protein
MDGRSDLVAANAGDSVVSVWLGSGDLTFGEHADFATGPTPKSIAVGDLNRDGRPDLVSANQDGASVSVLLGDGLGGFGPAAHFAACGGTHESAIGDFDRDGSPDLIVACWGGSVVSYLKGNGDGVFAPAVNYEVGAAPHSVVPGDFNADGLLDAAVANHDAASVSVLIGRGDGTFDPHVSYPVGAGPHSIRAGDVDNDGTLDLAVANDGSATISVLRGHGDGTFTTSVSYPTGSVPKGVAIADIDGDGFADLLSANTAGNYPTCCNSGGDTISLLRNEGNNSFAAARSFTVGTTPFAVSAGDLDGDGDLDVVTANWHSNDVTLLRNDGVIHLSDLSWTSVSNGYGPVERDRSNGENAAGDGAQLTLNGTTYTKGLGVHSVSDVRYALNGQCSMFEAVVGIDDEVGSLGAVLFRVFADGVERYSSGVMTGATASQAVSVSVAGTTELALVVTDGDDGLAFDHADWAAARVICTGTLPYLSDRSWTSMTNGWGPVEPDRSNGELGSADGGTLTIAGVSYLKGLGAHAFSDVRFPLNGVCSVLTAIIGVDDEVGNNGSVVFQVWTDGVLRYDSGVMTGADAGRSMSVNLTGANELALIVTDAGDGVSYDHADWVNVQVSCPGALPYLSDRSWTSMTNGWGPVEPDRSNGELGSADGGTLTIAGVSYLKGLGAHAFSDVRFPLNGVCSVLTAIIGVDDEVGNNGSVVFQVWTDGVLRYDSGVMTGADAGRSMSVNLTGANELALIVTDAGDGVTYDHADWANVQVSCSWST